MNSKVYSIIIFITTILAWFGFFVIINSFDPTQGNWLVFTLFYFVLFLAWLGTLALLGFWLRKLISGKRQRLFNMVGESFRQAFIFAAVLVIALGLQAARVLTWWNIALLVLLATVVEFVILLFSQNQKDKIS